MKKSSESERSPTFLQFMDCVFQIMGQYPKAFEFTESLLHTILFHLYSCRYGTFLMNCEKERRQNSLQNKTCALWAFLYHTESVKQITNTDYDPSIGILFPTSKGLKLWLNYYLPSHMHAYD